MNDELLNKIAVSMVPGAGSIIMRKLIGITGSPEALFSETKKNLLKIPQMPRLVVDNIGSKTFMKRAEEELAFVEKNNIKVFYFQDKDFPQRLNECYDAPVLLYSRGKTDFNKQKMVSVVGTRKSTKYGRDMTQKIISGLAESSQNVTIVSGLAFGIDITAHKAALANKLESIAVLAHGMDILYPSVHKETAKQMLENGALLTEYPRLTKPDAPNFVKRNRIVAGMCDATIIVESGFKGGAMITANLAFSYDREVLAVPGNSGNYFSEGCNFMIKTQKATMIESANDLIALMNWDINTKPVQKRMFVELNASEELIYNLLQDRKTATMNEIGISTGMPVSQVSMSLLNMEMQGIIKSLPGSMFSLC